MLSRHIESVFALSVIENVAVFQEVRTNRITLISCLDNVDRCTAIIVRLWYISNKCGVLRCLLTSGYATTFN